MENWMKDRQTEGSCEITVLGVADWKECLAIPAKLSPPWSDLCGGTEVPLMDYLKTEARVNNQSLERSVVTQFLAMGYQLEELEVEIHTPEGRRWGRCVWYKDHPAYQEPISKHFDGTSFDNPSFFHAMWETEHAGDQHCCLYSLQMTLSKSVLPFKMLIYRKVVFSPPHQEVATENFAP